VVICVSALSLELGVSVYVPVNANNDGVHGKWGVMCPILAPDLATPVVSLMGALEGIVDARDNEYEP
jgi:hypothetical protein